MPNTVKGAWNLGCQVLATFSVVRVSDSASQVPTKSYENKGCLDEEALIKMPGHNTTKSAVRNGDIIIYYYYCSKKKKIGAREKRVLAPENKLQHDS